MAESTWCDEVRAGTQLAHLEGTLILAAPLTASVPAGRRALRGAEARAHAEVSQHELLDAAPPPQHVAKLDHAAAAAQPHTRSHAPLAAQHEMVLALTVSSTCMCSEHVHEQHDEQPADGSKSERS